MIKAIPTTYKGTRFRSRLEARWAAFFDLAGILWDYEPCDMDGWAPDFVLHLKGANVFVEVKPVDLTKVSVPADVLVLQPGLSFEKACKHYKDCWVLLLGSAPQTDSDYFSIGVLLDRPPPDDERWFNVSLQLAVKDETLLWRQAGSIVQWKGRP